MKIRKLQVVNQQALYPTVLVEPDALHIETEKGLLFRIEEAHDGTLMISAEDWISVIPMGGNTIRVTTKPFDAFKKATLENSDV